MRKLRACNWLLGAVLCLCIVLSVLLCYPLAVSAAGTQGMITIELTDSYGDGWSDNAIEIYADGELLGIATMDDGASATWETVYNPHKVYEFRWINGVYTQETSFVIYVGTEQKVSASGYDYGGGSTILSLDKACTNAKYSGGVCSNCGTACPHSYVGKDGTCADCGRACSGHVWADGICSVCSGACLHQAYSAGKCSVCGKKMILSIEMEDAYSDGWTDNAINIYADGVLVNTVTINSGFTGSWSAEYNTAATYTFEWVRGNYAEECSFRILLMDQVCYEATVSDCSELAEGVFFTLEPWCDHAAYDQNFCCTSCGKVCPHTGLAPKGTCRTCGFTCGTSAAHIWENDGCKVCGLVCAHSQWTNSICDNCGFRCGTDAAHDFDANHACTRCNFVCGTSAAHAWEQGTCGVCGMICTHSNWNNCVCGSCGFACGTEAKHSFDANRTCTVCGFACGTSAEHTWNKGTCEVCGFVCAHPVQTNGVCQDCDYWQAAVENGVSENGFALYEIYNAGQLLWFADYVNSHEILSTVTVTDTATGEAFYFEYTSGCVNGRLMADIDMSGLSWMPIGVPHSSGFASRNAYGYTGVFDGNGHTVSGIDCTVVSNDNTVYAGFFGAIGGGTVKNLTVKGDIRGIIQNSQYPAAYVGGIAGYVCEGLNYTGSTTATQQDLYSRIENCTFIGSVSTNAADQEYAGGIVGMASAVTVENCFCAAAVSASGAGTCHIGSVCGLPINECTFNNCWYDSDISTLGEVDNQDHNGATGLPTDRLAIGSAAYALGFGQTLGTDPYPSYGDDPVFQVTIGCCTYSNTKPNAVTEKAHSGGACIGQAVCADCGVIYGESLGHNYVGGRCTNCADTKVVSISGTFNDWVSADMIWTENGYTCSMVLSADTYEFKIVKDGAWLGNNGIIVDTTTSTSNVGWEFVEANNCQLVTTGGTYCFTFHFDTNMLVVTYEHTHSHTVDRVVTPTCTTAGYTVYTCVCGDSYNGDTVAALGHAYLSVVTKPTCTTDGNTTHSCSVCGDRYVTDVVAAFGHVWVDATCTAAKTCSACGATDGKALGHSYQATVTTPTCTTDGFTTYRCAACGDSHVADTVAAPGHTWVAATCTTAKTCSACGVTEGEVLQHQYDVVVTAPACTANGYSTYTCTVCGDSYNGDPVAAIGHNYVAGKCTNCGDCKVVSINATFNNWAGADMHWTESGYTYSITLSADTYEFKLLKDGVWLGNNGTIFDTTAAAVNGWEFTEAGNCTLVATGGVYYFTFHYDANMLEVTQEHTHHYVRGKVVAPTCSAVGYTVYTCACGDSYNSDEVAALGHNYLSVVTKPTCTTDGNTTHTCSNCGDCYVTDVVAATGHVWVDATCTTAKTCSVCGATDGNAPGHSYRAEVTVPTCTTHGFTTYTCANCGSSYIADEVAAPGHRYNAAVTVPTCTDAGYTTYTCAACGDSYTGNTVAATGHHYVSGKCKNCHDTKIVSINGSFNDWAGADMHWTESGYTYSMVLAADTYEFKLVKDGSWLGNNGVIVDTTTTTSTVGWEFVDANNCTLIATGGTYHFTFHFDTNMLVVTYDHTHSYTAGKPVAPTCTEKGYTTYTCACNDSYNTDEVAALGHSYNNGVITTEPGCEMVGIKTYTCATCGHSYTETLDAIGHSYQAVVTVPTCTKAGYTTYTCATCADHYVDDEVSALGHNYVTTTVDATCTSDGSITSNCTVCGMIEVQTIPAAGHSYDAVVTAPTCTKAGFTTYTCSGCADQYVAEEVEALGHSYRTVIQDATCTEDGSMSAICDLCGHTQIVVIPAVGHDYETETVDADCTEEGSVIMHCTVCDDTQYEVIPALGHSFANGFCAACGEADPDYVKPVEAPTLTLKYPSVSFEDEVVMNVYYAAENLDDVVDMGLVVYNANVSEANIATANAVVPGYEFVEAEGFYCAHTNGIAPKCLGDTLYFAVYAKLADGTYTYTRVVSYSPKTYAYAQLSSGVASMKPLVVAMLNYGAEAQKYFNYNTANLVNANLTAAQKALVVNYSSDLMATIPAVSSSKVGSFAANGGFTRRYPTISFEGAFSINYYCLPEKQPVGDITLYVWNEADFVAADVLTTENATEAIKMDLTDSGEYLAVVDGIAAKYLDKGVYVSFVYSDGTTTYSTGVLAYSIGTYCNTLAAGTTSQAALAKATAVYGYYAKELLLK